ncbi:MAG TPA: flagellar basal body rod protein FlgB [Phycisphaerales bacterium]|nr:flagellar basal body rod protein FlgB [Phycisphaerales bacterium]
MSNFSLFDISDLERGLDMCSLRTQIISDNIANANTPEYQAKAVFFEDELSRVSGEQSGAFPWEKKPVVETTGGPVDIISEMTSLAKNQILYQAYSGEVTRHFSNLKWILDNTR